MQQISQLKDECNSLNKHLLLSIESFEQLSAASEIESAISRAQASTNSLNEQLLALGGLEDVPEPLTLPAVQTGCV